MNRLIVLALAGLLLLTGCSTIQTVPAWEAPPINGDRVTPAVADPVQVVIPALRVTDEVVPVGVCEKKAPPRCEKGRGEMELPDVSETGWYNPDGLGIAPGEYGRAVLASHVDWEGVPGAFKHLPDLKPGDAIRTLDAAGVVREWRVYDTHQIPKAEYAERTVPLLFGESGTELALVTCSGTVSGGSYLDNTIVRARPA